MTKRTFHVGGMHCNACTILVEDEARGLPGVAAARANLVAGTVELEGDFADADLTSTAALLAAPLERHGYTVSLEQPATGGARWGEFLVAAPVAAAILVGFFSLQRLGLVNLLGGGTLSYGAILLVGVVASLSSCLAVVGGLALSMSASYAKSGERVRPQLAFHVARLVGFFLLGGAVGAVGGSVAPGPAASLVLSLAVGFAMLALGVNLLDVFPWARRFQLSAPKALSRRALALGGGVGFLTPVALGVATFFLPCGFTQSMQLYALSRGSFLQGGLTMLTFALGTLPVLAAVSFGTSRISPARSGTFFKVAGLLAIAFALVNVLGSLAGAGIIPPVLNF